MFGLLIVCALGTARAALAADEIHWSIEGQTAVTFDWRGPENTISFGLTPAYGQTVTAGLPAPWPFSSPGPFWQARLTGLQENTLYHYSIGGGPDHTFRTPPPHGGSGFTVYAEGDIGDAATYPRMATIQSMIASASPQFVLVTGDLTYANNYGQVHCDNHFNDVMVWSQDAAYMPAWGYVEWDKTTDDLRNYKGRFDFPNPQTSPSAPDSADAIGTPLPYGKDWYWFDYGNTRFIAIPDPYKYGALGPWKDWNAKVGPIMDQAQADSAISFIVTYGHRPSYTSGVYESGDSTLRSYLDALGATHTKYVLDLAGHSNDYERTYPQQNVTHLICGIGGANLSGTGNPSCVWLSGCPAPAWSAFRAMHHATVQLHFTPTSIQGTVFCGPDVSTPSNLTDITCTQGSVIDSFTIVASTSDEIHWTIGGQNSVTFDWRGFRNTISYGLTSNYDQTVTAGAPAPWPRSSPGPFWEAKLTGLQENTLYHYSIGGGPDHTFQTPPPRGTSGFKVFAEGDLGDAPTFPRMQAIQNMIAAQDPQFVLMVGDLSYANDFGQVHCDNHFNNVMTWSQDAAYMPIWGNHEWIDTTDDLRNYKGRFDLPNAQTSPSAPDSADILGTPAPYGKDWYWFDYGNTRFIAIPDPYTYGPGGVWDDWNTKVGPIMNDAENDPAITFIVTFGHRPSYSTGHYFPGDTTLKRTLDNLGATYSKYVLDICGHAHDYERIYPQQHVTHITCGVGGNNLEGTGNPACLWNSGCPPPPWSAYRAMHHATVQLRFTPTTIEGRVVCGPDNNTPSNPTDITCTQGTVIDTFTVFDPSLPNLAVPVAAARRFGIDHVIPNPSMSGVNLAYSLTSWEPAMLEVLDPAGRLIQHSRLSAAGPGQHETRLGAEVFRAPGIYFVRLRQSGRTAVAKVSITSPAR